MIQIQTNKKGLVEMTMDEFAKWACLVEAFHFIQQRAEELEVNPIEMIKPLAIEKYIEERFPAMLWDTRIEHQMGNI